MQNQLCIRMSDNRLPGQVLYSHLTHCMRTRGGQRKHFEDTTKHYMKKGQVGINARELMAAEYPLWPSSMPTLQQDLQIKNRALESPQDT